MRINRELVRQIESTAYIVGAIVAVAIILGGCSAGVGVRGAHVGFDSANIGLTVDPSRLEPKPKPYRQSMQRLSSGHPSNADRKALNALFERVSRR